MATTQARPAGKTGWRATTWGELLSEYLGTLVLLAFGTGSVAVAVVGLTMSGRTVVIFQGAGGWLLITWGWAMAVVMGVYVAGGVSGAHLNPAVTLAMAIKGSLPWRKVPGYWIAQVLGAFSGAAIVYLDYYKAIDAWNLAHHVTRASAGGLTTFSIFATFPAKYFGTSLVGPFIDQVIGTFFLLLFVLAITDATNSGPGSNMAPFLVGMAVAAIGMSFGTDAGYAINPARDFGPRLLTWFLGWGHNAFAGLNGYWWVPIVGPLVGGAIAVGVYRWFIEDTIRARFARQSTEGGAQ
ncbi:MIP family channel protein [Acidimicrobium ferrooxidans DSM 10331]|uniref:MIP family channel protein n=1 Tax=Acidimicrobium ferrooxidans (strain DSM 10331 / JCM 15462 / NBRC 103882 / ICP) TaxID=525909 RepID=C7LYL2_ACIFD|nr:MIP family channel protein [Acidimicrobium ferrooxidans]ACU53820.1 MIP family channel protein [Acidimicrobium ferrooxidans DSM 10331]